jgi:hypothetical protein
VIVACCLAWLVSLLFFVGFFCLFRLSTLGEWLSLMLRGLLRLGVLLSLNRLLKEERGCYK